MSEHILLSATITDTLHTLNSNYYILSRFHALDIAKKAIEESEDSEFKHNLRFFIESVLHANISHLAISGPGILGTTLLLAPCIEV